MVREQVIAQRNALTDDLDPTCDVCHGEGMVEDDECENCNGYGEIEVDMLEALELNALSVEHTWRGAYKDDARWDGLTIVLCTGGPHVEIQYNGSGAMVVGYGWFGSDRYTEFIEDDSVLALCEMLADMAEVN